MSEKVFLIRGCDVFGEWDIQAYSTFEKAKKAFDDRVKEYTDQGIDVVVDHYKECWYGHYEYDFSYGTFEIYPLLLR